MSKSTYTIPFRGSITDLVSFDDQILISVEHPEGINLGLYSFSIKDCAIDANIPAVIREFGSSL